MSWRPKHNDTQQTGLICHTQHNNTIMLSVDAKCHVQFIVMLNDIMLSVLMLSVLMLIVVMQSVMAPFKI
jgi:hypothetical protein